jgi:hypothetical protein
VDGALLPDGSRGTVECLGILAGRPDNTCRRPDGNGGWIYGEVALGPDAVFKDADPQPRPAPRPRSDDGKPDLEADLAEMAPVLAAVQDDGFAQALYAAMCNQAWRKGAAGRWHCSWRHAGGIVAGLRGKGEFYNDWYCSGCGGEDAVPEGVVRADVRILLEGHGWHPLSDIEIALDHRAATRRIRAMECSPERDAPEWYRARQPHTAGGGPDLETWSGRLHHLAATGRVSREEWMELWELLDLEADRPVHDRRAAAALGAAMAADGDGGPDAGAPPEGAPPGILLH